MRFSYKSAGGSEDRPGGAPKAPEGSIERPLQVAELARGVQAVRFHAMGCPCEVLVQGVPASLAHSLGEVAAREAWRIEQRFSRYRHDSVTAMIHRARGRSLVVDEETAALLNFAAHGYRLSEGLFDITSGVLRRAWTFDGSDRLPDPSIVQQLLPLVGFSKLQWNSPQLQVPEGMEVDFGGIGKEYAVDRAFALLAALTAAPFLVNFGGDLRASRPPLHGPWQVGIERPGQQGFARMLLELSSGALATSGDSHRFLLKDGTRYGHILDPRTGWPVTGGPRSVTVAGATCTEAGMWSTLAMLKGAEAASFLQTQARSHWIIE